MSIPKATPIASAAESSSAALLDIPADSGMSLSIAASKPPSSAPNFISSTATPLT